MIALAQLSAPFRLCVIPPFDAGLSDIGAADAEWNLLAFAARPPLSPDQPADSSTRSVERRPPVPVNSLSIRASQNETRNSVASSDAPRASATANAESPSREAGVNNEERAGGLSSLPPAGDSAVTQANAIGASMGTQAASDLPTAYPPANDAPADTFGDRSLSAVQAPDVNGVGHALVCKTRSGVCAPQVSILFPPARELTPKQARTAAERREKLIEAERLFALPDAPYGQGTVAKVIHINGSKFSDMLKWAAPYVGFTAPPLEKVQWLLRAPLSVLAGPKRESKRPNDVWAALIGIEAVQNKLRELYIATFGASSAAAANDRRTGKLAPAIRAFAYEPECPAELAPKLKRGKQPKCFINFLRQITPEIEARIRGAKHAQLFGSGARRDLTCRLPDGRRFEMPAAYGMTADDMSENHPSWVEGPDGAILSRQGLYFMWYKHRVWQSYSGIYRPRESYRHEDILRAFLHTCLSMGGIPHYIEFEQGIWKSKLISGWRWDGDWLVEEAQEITGLDVAQQDEVKTGLALCGVTVLYKHSAHQKHIETHFNTLQTETAITARNYQCIGRYAGEFEQPGKQLRRLRAKSFHPAALGFAHATQLRDCILESFDRLNEKPDPFVKGKTRWEAHQEDLARVPLLPITPRLFAACLPGKPRTLTIRGQLVTVTINGVPHDYYAPELCALGDGYVVGVKVDETDPSLGAAIFNLTPRENSANHQGYALNEFIGVARHEVPGPKMNVLTAPAGVEIRTVQDMHGRHAIDQGKAGKKQRDNYVSSYYVSASKGPIPGQPRVRIDSVRDGKGSVVTDTHALPQPSNLARLLPKRGRDEHQLKYEQQDGALAALENLGD